LIDLYSPLFIKLKAGKSVSQGGMEDAPENGKESPHSVHATGLID